MNEIKEVKAYEYNGQVTLGNTNVKFKCKLGGSSKKRRIKFEWVEEENHRIYLLPLEELL